MRSKLSLASTLAFAFQTIFFASCRTFLLLCDEISDKKTN